MSPSSTSSSEAAPKTRFSGVREDLVVAAAPDLRPTLRRRVAALAVTTWFGVVILGTLAADLARPRPAPSPVGREKKEDDKRRAAARWTDGTAVAILEGDVRARSTVRAALTPWYAALMTHVLGGGDSERLVVGRDGQFFLRHRAYPRRLPSESMTAWPGNALGALTRRLASAGVELTTALLPRAVDVVGDRLYGGAAEAGLPLYDELLRTGRAAGARIADLKTRFRAETRGDTFLRTDSHWSPYGALLAAEVVAAEAGLLAAPGARDTEIEPLGALPIRGDLLRMAGVQREDGGGAEPWFEHVEDFAVRRKGVKERRAVSDSWSFGENMVVGTSFTRQGMRFPSYLGHFTGLTWAVAALPGEGPIEPLRRAVVEMKTRGYPRRLVLEIPAHEVFCARSVPDDLGEVFAHLPSDRLAEAPATYQPDWAPQSALKAGRFRAARKSTAAFPLPDALVATGDGVLSVRLRGTVTGGDLDVVFGGRVSRTRAVWRAGVGEITLPLVDAAWADRLRIAIQARGDDVQVELETPTVVGAFRAEGAAALAPAPAPADGGSGSADGRALRLAATAPHAGDVVMLRVEGAPGSFYPLRVTARWRSGDGFATRETTLAAPRRRHVFAASRPPGATAFHDVVVATSGKQDAPMTVAAHVFLAP
ncbi:MAG TPA: hypothetical protein VEI02_06310 [Planctomycetota bacterium]|nr:hypothetical protein [Planctomycetota bacterium]